MNRRKGGRDTSHDLDGDVMRALRRIKAAQPIGTRFVFTSEEVGPGHQSASSDGRAPGQESAGASRRSCAHASSFLRPSPGSQRHRHQKDPGLSGPCIDPINADLHAASRQSSERYLGLISLKRYCFACAGEVGLSLFLRFHPDCVRRMWGGGIELLNDQTERAGRRHLVACTC